MSISAKELAKKLNLSTATVSMVLNNKSGISDKTRNKVLDAAKKYEFDFSKFDKQTETIGIIQLIVYKKHGIVVTDSPFFSQLIEGIDLGCKQANYELQITYLYENDSIKQQLSYILDKKHSGILLLATEMEAESFNYFSNIKKPLVVIDAYFEELNCNSVLINNVQGAYIATSHLIKKGFSEVGYLHSSYKIGNFNEREEGYYKALRQNQLSTSHSYIHSLTPTIDGAYNDMLTILKNKCPIAKAYFADNDLIAAGAMRAFKEYGFKIPSDISIIGFDNLPICDILEPPLTTMDVPKKEIGKLAIEQLINLIKNPSTFTTKTELSPKLFKRMSVI